MITIRNIVFLYLLFFPVIVSAQTINVGARINYFTNFNQYLYKDFPYNISNSEYDWKQRQFSGDIVIENVRHNNIFHRIRIGYQKTFISNNGLTMYSGFTGTSRFTDRKEYGTEYRFGLGIGKLHEFEKFAVKGGVELSVDIGDGWNKDYIYEYFDINGIKTQTTTRFTNEPNEISGGISLFTGIGYNFWKSFWVDFEITNYFLYSQQKGTVVTDYEDYDGNGNLISSDTTNDEIDEKQFTTYFLSPSIGLSYRF